MWVYSSSGTYFSHGVFFYNVTQSTLTYHEMSNTGFSTYCTLSWSNDGKTVTYYSTNSTAKASGQLNYSNYTYYWIAFS